MGSFNVTSAGMSPEVERAKRMRFYTIAMSIRIACVASLFFVRGWWIVVIALGAIFLPYIAVLIANEKNNNVSEMPEPVPPLELMNNTRSMSTDVPADPPLIVVDDPAERRSSHTPSPPAEAQPQ